MPVFQTKNWCTDLILIVRAFALARGKDDVSPMPMNWSWKLGRVAGIDLYLHPTFLLLLLYVGLTQGGFLSMLMVAAVFGCVLLHELGHAMAARWYGIPTQDITLYPIGGVARLERMPRKPGPELVIALAGPAVNLAIAAGLAVVGLMGAALVPGWAGPGSIVPGFLGLLGTVNLVLAAFNLIPAFPMDGGRVLRALLAGGLGRLRATEIAATVGRTLAVLFGLYCVLNGELLQAVLAAFIYFAAGAERNRVRFEEAPRLAPSAFGQPNPWTMPTPPGRQWVYAGRGMWRLAPITVYSTTHAGDQRQAQHSRPWL
jgi:Zn-dependent protease